MSEANRVRDLLRDHTSTIPTIGREELTRDELAAPLSAEGRA